MSEDPPVLAAALRAGARGYLVRGSEPDDIARALEGVARGQVVFGEQIAVAALAPGVVAGAELAGGRLSPG